MSEWQPIETAPKYTDLLLAFDYGLRIGGYVSYGDISNPFVWVSQTGDLLARPWKDEPGPTHWMPLPAPPEERG